MSRRTRRMVRAALFGAIGTMALAAAGAGCTEPAEDGQGAAGALERATGVEWIVREDPATGAIRFAAPRSGPFALGAGAPGEEATLAFLEAQRVVLLEDCGDEFPEEQHDQSEVGELDAGLGPGELEAVDVRDDEVDEQQSADEIAAGKDGDGDVGAGEVQQDEAGVEKLVLH